MKTHSFDAFKILLCKACLGAAALFAAAVVLAGVQGTLAPLPCGLLLLLCLLVLNTLCGLLAPAPRARVRVRRGQAPQRYRRAAVRRSAA